MIRPLFGTKRISASDVLIFDALDVWLVRDRGKLNVTATPSRRWRATPVFLVVVQCALGADRPPTEVLPIMQHTFGTCAD